MESTRSPLLDFARPVYPETAQVIDIEPSGPSGNILGTELQGGLQGRWISVRPLMGRPRDRELNIMTTEGFLDAYAVFDALLSLPLQPVTNLPRLTGLYTLADHEGRHRYIGSTADKDFRDRIQNRHVTGSEGNSHKFSWAYNVGRMWRDRRATDSDERIDGVIAKKLRTVFIRRHCRAAWMPLTLPRCELEALERKLIRLAPPEVTLWNNRRLVSSPIVEPADLVSRLVDELRMTTAARLALGRQAGRYREFT